MKVYIYMWCHLDDNGVVKSETVSGVYATAQSAIKVAESMGYIEQINKNEGYDEFCIWASEEKPLLHAGGSAQVYIAEYTVKN